MYTYKYLFYYRKKITKKIKTKNKKWTWLFCMLWMEPLSERRAEAASTTTSDKSWGSSIGLLKRSLSVFFFFFFFGCFHKHTTQRGRRKPRPLSFYFSLFLFTFLFLLFRCTWFRLLCICTVILRIFRAWFVLRVWFV